MNLLALDLATRTGWAVSEDGRITSGVQTFDLRRGESPGMRYLRFRRWLPEVGARAELIVYEQTVQGPGSIAREIATGMATDVQAYCAERGIDHQPVWASTLKKFVTGKGNAKKPAMYEHARARGWLEYMTDGDDNEIDARCLLHYALSEIVPSA